MSVSLSRDNILPLMANQYFTEGISVIRDKQIQRLRLDLMSVDQILHVFFPQVAANFCLFWQINITSVSNIVFTWAANLSNSWYVNTKSRAWQMSVDQIFHVILFFLPRRRKIQNGREKMMTRFNKIYCQ